MTPTFFLSHAARKASDVRRPFPIKGNIRTSEWTWGDTAEGIHCPRNALTRDHYTPARSPHTFRCRILPRGTFFPRSTARAFSTCQLLDSTTPCANVREDLQSCHELTDIASSHVRPSESSFVSLQETMLNTVDDALPLHLSAHQNTAPCQRPRCCRIHVALVLLDTGCLLGLLEKIWFHPAP
jgi:hypothetical protein